MEHENSTTLEAFLTFLRDTEQNYRMSEAAEGEANDLTQDILHELELGENNYHSCANLARELRQARKDRRRAKDTMTESEPIMTWLEENRNVVKSLERLLGEVRKAERRTENRMYVPRVRKE